MFIISTFKLEKLGFPFCFLLIRQFLTFDRQQGIKKALVAKNFFFKLWMIRDAVHILIQVVIHKFHNCSDFSAANSVVIFLMIWRHYFTFCAFAPVIKTIIFLSFFLKEKISNSNPSKQLLTISKHRVDPPDPECWHSPDCHTLDTSPAKD